MRRLTVNQLMTMPVGHALRFSRSSIIRRDGGRAVVTAFLGEDAEPWVVELLPEMIRHMRSTVAGRWYQLLRTEESWAVREPPVEVVEPPDIHPEPAEIAPQNRSERDRITHGSLYECLEVAMSERDQIVEHFGREPTDGEWRAAITLLIEILRRGR